MYIRQIVTKYIFKLHGKDSELYYHNINFLSYNEL